MPCKNSLTDCVTGYAVCMSSDKKDDLSRWTREKKGFSRKEYIQPNN